MYKISDKIIAFIPPETKETNMKEAQKEWKHYKTVPLEAHVHLMFTQIAKKSGKTYTEFMVELLEEWRLKQK